MGSRVWQVPAATTACTENLHSRLVSMGKGFTSSSHRHEFLGSVFTTAGDHNKTNVECNMPVSAGAASFKDGWHNPMQNYESRKDEPKKVTWDEHVHVRTIEPCPGKGRGKWHHPENKHSHSHRNQWEESKQISFLNSVTSPVYDL